VVLVDSSAWVLVGRGELNLDARLPDEPIATCPPVVQEVLQGVRGGRQQFLMRLALERAEMLDESVPLARFRYAAQLFRECRAEGLTIRSNVDCLIAACAIVYSVPVLHDDRDFDHIAEVAPLRVIRP
jgi:predicted nucleic acid-binding protein